MSSSKYSLTINSGAGDAHSTTVQFTRGGPFRLTTKEWPNWFLYMRNTYGASVRGCKGPDSDQQGDFIFTPIDGGEFFLISTKCWKNWYVYMQNVGDGNVCGYEGDPGPQGHWRITPRADGSFLLSTKKWPDWYMYMQDDSTGNVRGQKGNPGPQGHFIMSCELKVGQFVVNKK